MSKRKRNKRVRDRFLRRRIEGDYRDLLVFYAPEAIDARRGDVVDMPGADGVRVLFEGQESQMTTAGALWLVRAWAKDGAMVAARIEKERRERSMFRRRDTQA